MDARQFLAEFRHIAAAPDGVKRLRELILALAFQGSLCKHDTIDASMLVTSIDKQRLNYFDPERKPQRRATSILQVGEPPYAIPEHWRWLSLNDIGHGWGQKTPPGPFTYIDVSSIDNQRGKIREPVSVVAASQASSRARKIVRQGTVIYSTVRPYLLNIALVDREFEYEPIASTAFAVVHPWEGILPKYVYYYLHSLQFTVYVQSVQSGIAYPAISDEKFFSGAIPIPSTAEQKRIVAKVDELMALCDKLEAQQREQDELRQNTYTAILSAFSQAYSKEQVHNAWQRLRQTNEYVFNDEASIASLEKTVFGLAINGRLAPQNTDDQHSLHLLETIFEERQNYIKAGLVKTAKRSISSDNIVEPFVLPQGWKWQRLEDLFAVITDGDHQPPPKTTVGVPFLVIGDLNAGQVSFNSSRFVSESYYEKLDWSRKPTSRDILYTVTGSFGIPILVNTPERFCVQRHVAILKSLPSTPTSYLMVLLHSRYAVEYAKEKATGIAQKTVSLSALRDMPVPIPPDLEQGRILQRAEEISLICNRLRVDMISRKSTASALATSFTEAITGIRIQGQEKMKIPKTELVSNLRAGISSASNDRATLAAILARNNGELSATTLWNLSGLEIDAFYQQLRTEILEGWIKQPEVAYVQEVEVS